MASVKVVLFTSKKLKDGQHPIMLRLIKDRKTKYISTGFACRENEWDKRQNKPGRKHADRLLLESVLAELEAKARSIILKLEHNKQAYNLEDIENKLRRGQATISVQDYILELIERFKRKGKIGTASSYKDLYRALNRYRKEKKLQFHEMHHHFLLGFEEDLFARGLLESSVGVYMRTLRAVYNKAIAEGYAEEEAYPFKRYKVSKLKTNPLKRALTQNQMEQIVQLDLSDDKKLLHAQYYFLFSFYNMGMNFKDMAYLKWQQVMGHRLYYNRLKTGKAYSVALLEPVQQILSYFKEHHPNDADFVFPILSKRHTSLTSQENRIEKVSKQVNENLKKIATRAGLDFHLTFYVARHSWATIMKRNGVSIAVISEGLGHDTEKTTQVYLGSFENSVLDEANKMLIMKQ